MGEEVGLVRQIVREPEDNADEGKCAIYIPALALAELGEACHRVRVTLALPFEEWARAAFASGKYHEAELTAEIIYVAQRLYTIAERGDRLIAATAVVLDLPRHHSRPGNRGCGRG